VRPGAAVKAIGPEPVGTETEVLWVQVAAVRDQIAH
jgi:hypothetical protein